MNSKISIDWVRNSRQENRKVPVLTAYDYPTARLLEECGVPVLLVGDSLGMVVLGHADTTSVTMADMEHHVRAVARGISRALLVADLPYRSYETPEDTVANARRLLAAGAQAVKLEGGQTHRAQLEALAQARIPVMGHLGMLPQSVREEGGYKIKGKSESERTRLIDDAKCLEHTGAFGIVLELVAPATAAAMTAAISIPTIGIGSGPDCTGQVLVTPDVIGSFPWFRPKFATAHGDVAGEIRRAVAAFLQSV